MYRDWGIRNFMDVHWTGRKIQSAVRLGSKRKKMITELSLVEKKNIQVG